MNNTSFIRLTQEMKRPTKKTKGWKEFMQAVLRVAPKNYVDAWTLQHPTKPNTQLQGGTLKHILVALNDDDDEFNELTATFAEMWEGNQIVIRRAPLTGRGSRSGKGKKNAAGEDMDHEFNFSQMNKLKGIPMEERKELLRLAISGAMTWSEVTEVR